MSIVRMKRLRLMVLAEERERALKLLAHLGIVELSETPADEVFISEENPETAELADKLDRILDAQAVARKYGKFKKGLFAARPMITERELFSAEIVDEALEEAGRINRSDSELAKLEAEKSRLITRKEGFIPWKSLDVALDADSGKFYETNLCTIPKSVGKAEIEAAVAGENECAECFIVSSDKELHYVFVISFCDEAESVRERLKQLGAAIVKFRGVNSTAGEQIATLEEQIKQTTEKINKLKSQMSVTAEQYDKLLVAQDALENKIECASAAELGKTSARTFYVEGWCPARDEKGLAKVFEENGYAYDFADPEEGEEPPTLTYNSKLIAPFTTVTNMYSPPAYSGIDPNPFMAPFFAMFFGIMLSDAGYGLLLMLAGIFALWKMKPKGGFKNFMQLAIICGATTIFWGLMFGGIFGNTIPAVYELFTGNKFEGQMALWFDPTNDPMTMLIFSMALGAVQIITSMAIKAYMMIRDGHVWDAIFDIGSWYVVFAGGIICIFNSTIGLYVLGAGALMLILTQGRAKKNIFAKLMGGIGSLYDVTSYFSDILSYSRLLALSLATAVVAQVINTMGMLTGPIGFFIVFLIGHVFNIAINLIGSFVHSARLQYVEFFGRFYESGGRLFAPLSVKTKNTDIIKEEN